MCGKEGRIATTSAKATALVLPLPIADPKMSLATPSKGRTFVEHPGESPDLQVSAEALHHGGAGRGTILPITSSAIPAAEHSAF